MRIVTGKRSAGGILHLPNIWGFGEKPSYVPIEDLQGQLDKGRFLIDGNLPGLKTDARKLGVACRGAAEVNSDFILVHHGLKFGGELYNLYGVFDGVSELTLDGTSIRLAEPHKVSEMVAKEIMEKLAVGEKNATQSALVDAIQKTNNYVYNSSLSSNGFSTATLGLIGPKHRDDCIVHVGNSRAYLVGKKRMEQITRDHALYVNAGDGRRPHLRSMMGIQDLRYDITGLELPKKGFLLLTTKGVHDVLEPDEMREIVWGNKDNLHMAASKLVDNARKSAFASKKLEDASVIIARI